MHVHTIEQSFHGAKFNNTWSSNIGNSYLRKISVRILLKQFYIIHSLFLRGDSWFGLWSHQLLPHRKLKLIYLIVKLLVQQITQYFCTIIIFQFW